MTHDEIKYLLKRYSFISKGIIQGKDVIFITSGGRKERIVLDDTVKNFSGIVIKTLDRTDEFARKLMKQSILDGHSDIFIYTNNKIPKSTYYHLKSNFRSSLFHYCIYGGLVKEEEI